MLNSASAAKFRNSLKTNAISEWEIGSVGTGDDEADVGRHTPPPHLPPTAHATAWSHWCDGSTWGNPDDRRLATQHRFRDVDGLPPAANTTPCCGAAGTPRSPAIHDTSHIAHPPSSDRLSSLDAFPPPPLSLSYSSPYRKWNSKNLFPFFYSGYESFTHVCLLQTLTSRNLNLNKERA